MAQKTTTHLTPINSDRRRLLVGSAAVTAAASLGLAPASLQAKNMQQPNAIKQSFSVGDFQVATLLAGTRTADNPQSIFGMNVSSDEFAAVSADNFIPADKNQFFFTPTVVQAGDEVVLFDAGLNADGILAPLAAAGIAPSDVTIVVLTHMHPRLTRK